MAVLPILISGEPVLHTPAKEVTEFDDTLRQLVADMKDTMHAAPGVGLAGPQVGVGLRLFVYEWEDDEGVLHEGTAINPELLISPTPAVRPDKDADAEGCLSLPGERYPLVRSEVAVLRALDVEGKPFEVRATGWLARILQHEYDHLEGVLYADRLEDGYRRAAQRIVKRNKWGVPGLTWMPGEDDLEG